MTEQSKPQNEISEELRLLRKIDQKVEAIDEQMANMKKTAAVHGAVAGGISGGIVAAGLSFAKIKLGL
ncbi:hypothetical protein ACO0K0_07210 [Undibacterium sp. SXout11W]|uniref:hypothetical protein n=1 Tax=Undibacterium sp. SXout11W TaxID=3413050 RepID=UPI003BEFE21D